MSFSLRAMTTRQRLILGAGVLVAVVCVRLGIWQLDRLEQRKAHNAMVIDRLRMNAEDPRLLPRDTSQLRYRRAIVSGHYDYQNQFVLASRSRHGSPGVNIVTPVRVDGTDTAVLVNRGWVYAPDGMRTNLARWHEGDSVSASGYIQLRDRGGQGNVQLSDQSGAPTFRWFDPDSVQRHLPYPVYPFIVALDPDTLTSDSVPPRVPPPALDEGPHAGYAFQWFTFATVFLSGAIVLVMLQQRAVQDQIGDPEVDTDPGHVD